MSKCCHILFRKEIQKEEEEGEEEKQRTKEISLCMYFGKKRKKGVSCACHIKEEMAVVQFHEHSFYSTKARFASNRGWFGPFHRVL
jgi:hypothetical protein